MYKILDIADLSVEGVYPLGGACVAISIVAGLHPIVAMLIAAAAGAVAGLIGAIIHTKLKIPALLTGILIMTGLYSINIKVMGGPNINLGDSPTIFKMAESIIPKEFAGLFVGIVILLIIITLLFLFYKTEIGLAFIATGDNEVMAQANSINTDNMKIIGYMLSNGLVALAGALLVQYNGYADAQSGVGTIVIGLAAVIIATVIVKKVGFAQRLVTVVCGAIIYRVVISLVLELNIEASDLKLISAIILTIFLCIPNIQIFKSKGGLK